MFHSVEHIRAALDAAASLGAGVTLRTAPGAIHYAGPLYLLKLVETAFAERPPPANVRVRTLLDCGDDAALAYAALRTGWRALLFTGPARVRVQLAATARRHAAVLEHRPSPALDLLDHPDPPSACLDWFAAGR